MEKRSSQPTNQLSNTEARWFAVYTKYKSEKLVANHLCKKGIEAYVPLLKYTRKYTRKVKQVEIPLISCYVFVKIKKEDYVKVLQTLHVISFLKLKNALIAIPEKEIDTLKWVVGEERVEKVSSGTMSKGMEVEVVAGNLTGLKGRILKRKSKKYLLVSLENIGYTLEVDISEELLQILKPAAVLTEA